MNIDRRLTKLVPTLNRILNHHNAKAFEIHQWLRSLGAKTCLFFDTVERFQQRTSVELRIRHDNDYIECGPCTADPEGKMFHVFTMENIEIKFPADKLSEITKTLRRFADHELTVKGLEYVILSFFDWERKLSADWWQVEHDEPILKMEIKFRIYHRSVS